MRIIKLLILFIGFNCLAQQGGMWIPSLLKGMNEQEMQALGSKLTAEDIYSVNNSSLKDAIGHFNGGCTSEVISSKGLLLTNHHCGFSQIQSHSSLENDYLKNGFWAMNLSEELPNKGLFVQFIVRIEDVTNQVLKGVSDGLSPKERQALIDKNSNQVQKNTKIESWQETKVKSFFKGNQYFLFVTETFEDIRLVGAPPSSIGKFGSDTDNWVFPRHTGDFSLFRIYADKNNRPAKYSEDNVPYTPKHYLPVSLDGVSEDDFTMVFGFPGRTNEYLPAVAVEQITQKVNPSNIKIREEALKVIDAAMKKDDKTRIQYASKQARIANYWKKWIGENLGIEKSGAIAKKKALEAQFTKALKTKGLEAKYGTILADFDKVYKDFEPLAVKRSNFLEVFLRNNEMMQIMFRLYQLDREIYIYRKALNQDNLSAFNTFNFDKDKARTLGRIMPVYKNFNADVDKAVLKQILPLYTKRKVDIDRLYEKTSLLTREGVTKLLEGDYNQVYKKLNKDEAYKFAKPFIKEFYDKINPEYGELSDQIAALQKQYMKALMEVLPSDKYYPDANSTLRVTYGKVKGYAPRDAVYYNAISYLDGVIEKYKPEDYEFDVPEKLLSLYKNKDFGQYTDATGKVPVCFIGTNHTTGGNSGSPAIDAHGNLVGLNFDRVWEGTMSDMNYDPEICRNIMVDTRYVLFIIDKFAGAKHLIDEMELVHPKKSK